MKTIGNIKKIILIRNDKIGDLVLSSNIIAFLKKAFPNARIDMIVSKENFQLVEKNKNLENIMILNYSPRKIKDFIEYAKFSKIIRKEKYDLGIDARGSLFNVAALLFLGKVKYKVGYYTNNITKFLLDYAHLKDYKGHASENMIKMMNKALKKDYPYIWPQISFDEKDEKELDYFIKKNKINKCISLCVDASNDSKQWQLEKFDEIIKYLKNKYPKYKINIIGVDKNIVNELVDKNPFCIPLMRKNLRFIYLLFKKSELVIAPDGGLMHIAWVAKSKLIAFVPSNLPLEDIKPLGKNSNIIYKEVKKIETSEVKKIIDKILK